MLNRIQRTKNKKGFTLVELIVVIAIIAILTAVIVPLVGRYSAQASYSTLQAAAKSISDQANEAVQDAVLSGEIVTIDEIVGAKSSGSLQVSGDGKTATATSSTTSLAHDAGGDYDTVDVDQKVLILLADALFSTLPDGSSFYVSISNNAVLGVVYTADSTVTLTGNGSGTAYSTADFQKATAFEEGYEWSSDSKAVGLSGKFRPTADS